MDIQKKAMYDDKKRNIESLELPFFCNERTKPHLFSDFIDEIRDEVIEPSISSSTKRAPTNCADNSKECGSLF